MMELAKLVGLSGQIRTVYLAPILTAGFVWLIAFLVARDPYIAFRNALHLEKRSVAALLSHSREQAFELLKLRKVKYRHITLESSELESELMPTRLSPLRRTVAKKLIEHGYCEAHRKLASEPDPSTLKWIRELKVPRWANTKFIVINKLLIVVAVLVAIIVFVQVSKELPLI